MNSVYMIGITYFYFLIGDVNNHDNSYVAVLYIDKILKISLFAKFNRIYFLLINNDDNEP